MVLLAKEQVEVKLTPQEIVDIRDYDLIGELYE